MDVQGCDDCEMLCHDTVAGRRFCAFHNENPHVYEKLRDLCFKMLRKGKNKWSISGVFEVLRWEMELETTGEDFKLYDGYKAWYSRMLMKNEPRLRGFFSLSKSKADNAFPKEDVLGE